MPSSLFRDDLERFNFDVNMALIGMLAENEAMSKDGDGVVGKVTTAAQARRLAQLAIESAGETQR